MIVSRWRPGFTGCFLGLVVLLGSRTNGWSQEVSHPLIPALERSSLLEGTSPAEQGLVLAGELNCVACHQADPAIVQSLNVHKAPILSQVGNRASVEFLKAFIADPQKTKPGTLMPNLFAGKSEEEKTQQVEALVHFLASTGSFHHTPPNGGAVNRGELLFHQVGCAACHDPSQESFTKLETSVPLGLLSRKYNIPALTQFLLNPHAVRPSGRMPSLLLTQEEASDLANFLLKDIDVQPNIRFHYYEGDWGNVPDFSKIEPKSSGGVTDFDLAAAARKNNFGMRFEGFLHVPRDGRYTFHIGSDDGSKLTLDGKPIVLNDGVHPFSWKSEAADLKQGVYPLIVDYTQGGGEWELRVEWEGPDLKRQPLAPAVSAERERPEQEEGLKLNPELVQKGSQIFAAIGCASCHEMQVNNATVASTLSAPAFGSLKPEKGCIATAEKAGQPHFSLSQEQQSALNGFLKGDPAVVAKPVQPQQVVHRTMLSFNCYACHTRDKKGGVEEERNELFTSTIPEMGDEGRLPPPLDGVGDKINADYLKHIFADGTNDRPYMLTRMPKFGHENLQALLPALESEALDQVEDPEYSIPVHQVKAVGRSIVGEQNLACIKCHTFGKHKATGIQSIDLTIMTQRLRKDWFQRYMINPQVYRPGTRMPSAYPNGESILPDIFEGHPNRQITSMWTYLSDGIRAQIPTGIINDSMELVPIDEPIIYRNFIQDVSPRGIAVGYPERLNLTFDAERMVLALIWQGSFIDASMHWTGRGQGFQRPAGDAIISLPREVSFAQLPEQSANWPSEQAGKMGYRFQGYSLDEKRRPHFRYTWNSMKILDFPEVVVSAAPPNFARHFEISSEEPFPEGVWYRAAVGKIEPTEDGWFIINNALRMRLQTSADQPVKAVLRQQGGQQELLLPLPAGAKQMKFRHDIVW